MKHLKNTLTLAITTLALASSPSWGASKPYDFQDRIAQYLPAGSTPAFIRVMGEFETEEAMHPEELSTVEDGAVVIALYENSRGETQAFVSVEIDKYMKIMKCDTGLTGRAEYDARLGDVFELMCPLYEFSGGASYNENYTNPSSIDHPLVDSNYVYLDLSFFSPKGRMFTTSTGPISQRIKLQELYISPSTGGGYVVREGPNDTALFFNPKQITQEYFKEIAVTTTHSLLNLSPTANTTVPLKILLPGTDNSLSLTSLKAKYDIFVKAVPPSGEVIPLWSLATASSATLSNLNVVIPATMPSGQFRLETVVKDKATGKQARDTFAGNKKHRF
jgi:hypothetical protein